MGSTAQLKVTLRHHNRTAAFANHVTFFVLSVVIDRSGNLSNMSANQLVAEPRSFVTNKNPLGSRGIRWFLIPSHGTCSISWQHDFGGDEAYEEPVVAEARMSKGYSAGKADCLPLPAGLVVNFKPLRKIVEKSRLNAAGVALP